MTTGTANITLPRALPHQVPVLLDPSRFKVVVCGRRWGKTALGLLATVRGHGPHRGARRGAIDGAKVWWVAPDYPTAAEIWRDLKRATRNAWTDKDEVERRIELPSGGSVTVKSAHDPDSLVAVGLDGLVIDEAAKVAPEAWYGSLRATLSDREGWAIFISTPKGGNWFKEVFDRAGAAPGWARWQQPTWANPLISADEIEAARLDSPRYFEQEYAASFTAVEGAEWPPDYFPPSLWFEDWPHDLQVKAVGLDPSKGKDAKSGDYAAFVWGGRCKDCTLWLDADLRRGQTAEGVAENAVEIQRAFNADIFGVEANQFQQLFSVLILQAARRHQVLMPLAQLNNLTPKPVRIRRLGPYLARKQVRVRNTPGGRLLVDQWRSFPEGEHDDGPDAAEMMLRCLIEVWNGRYQRGRR